MTWDEYNKLFHKTQANLVAFQPLMQCDHEVIKMIEAAVEAEREACTPKREWQGLTDEECDEIWEECLGVFDCLKMTEAKLKEKNA